MFFDKLLIVHFYQGLNVTVLKYWMMELLSSVLWNVFLFTFLIFLFSLPSPVVLIQTYLTSNTMYIVDAAEPISLLFLFFLIVATSTFLLNYYFQIYLSKNSEKKTNTTKKLFSNQFFWTHMHLNLIKVPFLVQKEIK